MDDFRHLSSEAKVLLQGWCRHGYDLTVADEMARKLISVQQYEAELSANERDFKSLTWGQLMATLAGAGSEMSDFNDRLQRLQDANNAAYVAALSADDVFNDVSVSFLSSVLPLFLSSFPLS